MAGLAEDSLAPPSAGRRVAVVLAWLAGAALVLALGWWLKGWVSAPSAPARQVARIAVLPDTPPPPPPPPPKDLPKPEPRDADRPPPPDATPKPAAPTPPADAPIKMEGAAGDGPSAFQAGPVSRDYQGGAPTIGASAPGGGRSAAERAQDRLYAQAARQTLQAEIERRLRVDADTLAASFALWLDRSGAIERVELLPGTDARHEAPLREAIEQARQGLRLPPPPSGLPQPMRFRLTVRAQG